MSFLDHQETADMSSESVKNTETPKIEIKMPTGTEFVTLNKYQIERKYNDELGPRLMVVIDEVAELLTPGKVKTEAGKEEDANKAEIAGIIQSITQLGRSSGITMVLATQRNSTEIISGVIQSNCAQRIIAGRLQTISSIMATGSSVATLIPPTPGSGAIFLNGKFTGLQHYFATGKWMEEWNVKRGFDAKGNPKFQTDHEETEEGETLEGAEEIKPNKEVVEFEFLGIEAKIDKTEEQVFEEV